MFRGNHAADGRAGCPCADRARRIFGPMVYPTDPFDMVWAPFSPPGEEGFLLGTDYLGRDLLARKS